MLLSIVTATYNRLSYLQQMVWTARASMPNAIKYEFVITDGSSTDGTGDWCKAQSDINLITQKGLPGAIHAFAPAFEAATGKYLIIANDDISFVGKSITAALRFMEDNLQCGIGCFYQDRSNQSWHVAQQPAHTPEGKMISVYYGQVCIVPNVLAKQAGYWGHTDKIMKQAKTYGGDNFITSRILEMGYTVEPIPDTKIHDYLPQDALRERNNTPTNNQHPDTAQYLKRYPQGPELPTDKRTRQDKREIRILYAPIYEPGHQVQHAQKIGLRRALQRIGAVWEYDYLSGDSWELVEIARLWKPDLMIGQFHDAKNFTADHTKAIRQHVKKLVNWNGDVYPRSNQRDYVEMLKWFDLATVVNAVERDNLLALGVKSSYWQAAYEPLMVGKHIEGNHDILLCGSGYSQSRQAFAGYLRTLPYNVGIYGLHWLPGIANGSTQYDFKRTGNLCRGAKIVIGDNQWLDSVGFVSDRLFNALAAGGGMVLHQDFTGMTEYLGLQDGVHLVTWNDLSDLRSKLDYYIANPDKAKQIAQQGQQEVLLRHSFEARLSELWDKLSKPHNVPAGVSPNMIGVDYV